MNHEQLYDLIYFELQELAKNPNSNASDVDEALQKKGFDKLEISKDRRARLLKRARKELESNPVREIVGEAETLDDFLTQNVNQDEWEIVKASAWGKEEKLSFSVQLKPTKEQQDIRPLADILNEHLTVKAPSGFVEAERPATALVQIDMPDLHFNKRFVDQDKAQKENDYFNIYANLLQDSLVLALAEIEQSDKELVDLVLLFFNDMLNSEATGNTNGGTNQENIKETHKGFGKACKFLIDAINFALNETNDFVNKIHIPVVLGNHAPEEELRLSEVVDIVFADNDRVILDKKIEGRKYIRFGQNLIAYEHGHRNKPYRSFVNMSTERPKDFAECKYKYVFGGHFHKSDVIILKEEDVSINYTRLRSLTEPDYWHATSGWVGLPGCSAHIFFPDGKNLIKKEVF